MITFCLCFLISPVQQPIEIPFFEEAPVVDGIVSEGEWEGAYTFSARYTEFEPVLGKKIKQKTDVKAAYDRGYFYLLFEAHQDTNTLVERKGTRDNVWDQDGVGITIDPLGNKQEYHFIYFGLSGTICDFRKFRAATDNNMDMTWDADVEFTSARATFGYVVEVRIPFRVFRRPSGGEATWNINFYRRIEFLNSQSLYSPLPEMSNEAEYESLVPIILKGIAASEKLEITPYGIYGSTFDSVTTRQGNAGFDMKVPVGATGVANFAFNPDFSQLEGDPLQFDFYSQYAVYFPEYRPFFVEEKGVFQTDRDLFYSRKIQNPFVAGRYTYRDPGNQAGVIFAYDEEDSMIGNTEAVAAIGRYTRQYGQNNAGMMILDRHDMEHDYNNLVLMTDGNLYLPFDIKLTYQLAGTSIDSASMNIFSDIGLYHHGFLTYASKDWIVLGNLLGRSPSFTNELGYVYDVNENYVGGFIARRFYLDHGVLKRVEIAENFGFSGAWSRFDNYVTGARDSIEYFGTTKLNFNLFSGTFAVLDYTVAKTFWENVYLERRSVNSYWNSRVNKHVRLDGSLNGGYMFDFNLLAVGEYRSGHANLFLSPRSDLTVNGGASFCVFDTDTARQALSPSDVENPVYTWRTFAPDVGIGYCPTNSLSFRVAAQRQIAHLAPGYDGDEKSRTTEDKVFGVIEYKPSIGNVIYMGARYPEKLLFFKFSHRFKL